MSSCYVDETVGVETGGFCVEDSLTTKSEIPDWYDQFSVIGEVYFL